jgi:hypothetical protein
MRQVATPGRWIWGVSGLATLVAVAIPGAVLITSAGVPWHGQQPQDTVTRTVTVPQPITGLDVQSYGAPVQVTSGPVRRARVTETITYGPRDGGLPAVTQSVSGRRLTLADPACNVSDCSVSFTVTVPLDVAVTTASAGGPVTVSGVGWASLDSGGGPVDATGIDGPLTVTTEGGPLLLNGLTGPLHADTGGGPLLAQDVAAATGTVITGGGEARIGFTAAPDTLLVSTDGGPATLAMPGGPYALTADSGGGPQVVGIATDPAARRSITVTSGGGPLTIEPATGRTPAPPAKSAPTVPLKAPAG